MKRKLKNNASTILTILSVIGVLGTAYAAIKATEKSTKELEDKEELSTTEKIELVWTNYIPTAVIGSATIGCIVGSNILNKKQQASLASAYGLVSSQYNRYKNKVIELYGEETHQTIVDALVKEDVDEDVCVYSQGFLTSNCLSFNLANPEEKHVFYDIYSNRYFETTISRVLEAEYHLNRNYTMGADVSLNDFYEFLGIPTIAEGAEIGWYLNDEIYWLDFNHTVTTFEDGSEVLNIEFCFDPRPWSEYDL